jgi:hypothetical protein
MNCTVVYCTGGAKIAFNALLLERGQSSLASSKRGNSKLGIARTALEQTNICEIWRKLAMLVLA